MDQKSLGICIGASTFSAVTITGDENKFRIENVDSIPHHGNPREILDRVFKNGIPAKVAVTGRKFRNSVNLTSISEPEAIEQALEYTDLECDMIISAGGENFILYELDKNKKIEKSITGNKCASGTGEFFLQQIKRMDLDIENAISLAQEGDPYNISGRCSVFCKSDCTHALNKGIPKKNVVSGLSKMMAQKIIELSSKSHKKRAVVIGGTTKNSVMMSILREDIKDLHIPLEASYFEAYGAAIYALKNETVPVKPDDIFINSRSSFSFHQPLADYTSKVHFREFKPGILEPDDTCIIGLDVGSTTTKAILLKLRDNSVIASEYLRTNGDPVNASIECYKSIKNQITGSIKIIGLGVTGSGRYIAGLHAGTKGIINEIIAHATATLFFDKEVDTIFEIGGQDAKYTYITAGVPSDYAMNEACSAGTGSFLEEAAKESLNIDYKEIGGIALKASMPPNFNDQCSAFISSDIKNALHEGLSKEDIIAGLVYSICMNYANRVKGNRPVGRKIFMQGGVCYNKAVPVAMAALTGKEIIVPPEPGLMGAFGVALEVKNRMELGFMPVTDFDLQDLIDRQVEYEKSFICAGGSEKCDRKCSISLISINGKKYPFGGACNKYYNRQLEVEKLKEENNFVKIRQELVFDKYIFPADIPGDAAVIGIPKSFFTNTLYPLFYNFFAQLGFNVILGGNPDAEGIEKQQAPFCYPVELAHGFFEDVIKKNPDYIFMPHILEIYDPGDSFMDRTCVLLQSESYYLKTTFKDDLNNIRLLSPILDFSRGFENAKRNFIELGGQLGKSKAESSAAFDFALTALNDMFDQFKRIGSEIIRGLERDKKSFAIVLFGRAYNSFAEEANLGIPQKFSSRNVTIIPHDFLSSDEYESKDHMYWGMGNQIIRSARLVKEHPQLFGSFITNFSCGPDSFIITYFRDIMGNKPSLTLELDSHSADAGINTRIEAALDIMRSYIELRENFRFDDHDKNGYKKLELAGPDEIIDSEGFNLNIRDENVKMIIPNMGRFGTDATVAAFRFVGIKAEPLPPYEFDTLKSGRGNTTCKECLPLILTTGSMIDYCQRRDDPNERSLFFMAESNGPCRLGQYHVFLNDTIEKKKLKNIGVYTLSDEDAYTGLGDEIAARWWAGITCSDTFQNMKHAILAIAEDKIEGLIALNEEWAKIAGILENGTLDQLYEGLREASERLRLIKRKVEIKDAVKISLVGEIFVRHDEFSRVDLIDRLAEKEIVALVAPVGEYVYYSNFLAKRKSLKNKLKYTAKDVYQKRVEKNVKRALSKSGFYEYAMIDVDSVIKNASHLIRPELDGEAILTVGTSLHEILDNVSGVISIGPFGCMPSRVAESILNSEMTLEGKQEASGRYSGYSKDSIESLPFLAIETDGNIYPQIIQSKIEIFILQSRRLHRKISEMDPSERRILSDRFYKLITNFYHNKLRYPSEEDLTDFPDVVGETK